jgi:hypothetical protein
MVADRATALLPANLTLATKFTKIEPVVMAAITVAIHVVIPIVAMATVPEATLDGESICQWMPLAF